MSYTPYFFGERMVSISFKGCDFECIGCLRKKREKDIYAEEEEHIDWNFESIKKKIEELKPHRIYLGGYEPTFDPDLPKIVKELSKFDAHIVLLTNGNRLNREYAEELKKAGVREVILSVKAFDQEKHRYWTKNSNEQVLKAIKELAKMEDPYFRLQIETILIPGINEPKDIENLAIFISEINPAIKLFIEPLIPTGDEFREPTRAELIEAVSRAMRHLYIVSYHPLYSEIEKIRNTQRKARFIDISPRERQDFGSYF